MEFHIKQLCAGKSLTIPSVNINAEYLVFYGAGNLTGGWSGKPPIG